MAHSRIALLVGIVLFSLVAAPVMAAPTSEVAAAEAAAPVCNGKYKGGLAPSAAELEEILNKHAAWLNDGGPYNHKLADDPRKANLCEASLSGAHLEGKDLTKADLRDAHLSDADLRGADLRKAFLWGAHLSGANLWGAQVSKAKLAGVDMTDAFYAPASEPPDPYVARIKGLATFSAARGEEIGLIQLRKLLQDAGL